MNAPRVQLGGRWTFKGGTLHGNRSPGAPLLGCSGPGRSGSALEDKSGSLLTGTRSCLWVPVQLVMPRTRAFWAQRTGLFPCSWQVARAPSNWICEFGVAVYRKLLVPRTGWKLDFRLLAWRCSLIPDSHPAYVWGAQAAASIRGGL